MEKPKRTITIIFHLDSFLVGLFLGLIISRLL
jgi:hypothetical protein